jgi:2,4-dienoyl-CoA reductase-like NADH-dependent reductase (Old Yellow Enzyme family)
LELEYCNMIKLFETTSIKNMTLSNRFVRSATYSGMANADGTVTPKMIDLMVNLANGGVGLIISAYAYVLREGVMHPRALGIYNDSLIPGLRKMVDAVHQVEGKIVVQLAHGGAQARTMQHTGQNLMGPSDMTRNDGTPVRMMTHEDIQQIISAFGLAATRAKQAGFDGVQLHGAHGYLLSEFLSPFFNKRTDRYGGNLANRSRFVLEVYNRVRSAVGKQYPVMIKVNSEDFVKGGLTVDQMLQIATILDTVGMDVIELSGGIGNMWKTETRPFRMAQKGAYYYAAAKRFKKCIDVPLMLVGGIRSFEEAAQLVEEGTADYVSLCRPFIRDPTLINRWKSGDMQDSACISCRACMNAALHGQDLHCVQAS